MYSIVYPYTANEHESSYFIGHLVVYVRVL